MKNYPRTPSGGGPMTAKIEFVRQWEHALAHAPSRDQWLAKWGLKFSDAKVMRLGLHNQCLAIPFFDADGTLLGVKLRKLGGDGDLRYFWQSPGNAPPIYLPPEGLDGGSVLVAEGPFKGRALTVILGRPSCALASGVRVGLPKDALQHFRGKDVHYISDPDNEGMAGPQILARQLKGVARSLKAIPFPPQGWTYKGQKADDVNDVLHVLRANHTDIETALPGIAAWILRELEKSPELLNGRPEPARRDFVVPEIDAGDLHLPSVGENAWTALLARNDPPAIFRRGGIMSCLERDDEGRLVIRPMSQDRLRHLLGQFASWYMERKAKGSRKAKVPALPPGHVVKDLLARPNPPLPVLARIVHAPIFDRNGVLAATPGYHEAPRTYYAPAEGFSVAPVPVCPTQVDLVRARTLLLDELLGDFPFVGEPELAHAMSFLVLPYARELIEGPTPLHLFEKPSPGTGATLLADVLTMGMTEGRFSTMTEGRDEDEWRKRITARLMGGAAIVVIDNLRGRLQSAALSSAITATIWTDRVLGLSVDVNLPVRCAWAATANNPGLSGEITRRCIRIRLDAKVDRPWLREKFRHPALREWAEEHRAEIVWATLVLVRAWLAKGRPGGSGRLGMFESWAKVVGGILEVAGIPGFLGNLTEFYDEADTEGTAWRAFVLAWWDRFAEREIGVSDLWTLANPEDGDPFDLGLTDGKKDTDRSGKIRLGKRLGEIRDRQFEGYRVVKAGTLRRAQQWKLVCVNV